MRTKNIKTQIAEKLSGATDKVMNSTIEQIANDEIERRTAIVTEVVRKIERMEKAQAILEIPDVTTFAKDGTKNENYSKERFENISKMKEIIAKLTESADKAIEENTEGSYELLKENLKNAISDERNLNL